MRFINPNQIGQAWTGKHVIIITCFNDQLSVISKSNQAPFELPSKNCAETLARYVSIGYKIHRITPLTIQRVQYLLVL
ncbi:hypothetical protein ACNRWW_12280 [Metabacillus sp. HB246100]|uniref:hypothetical protein n=1 Tax=Bacillus weihaiensis TaxID=1547283 RepID=UPI002354DB4D|nr:hypothetical protein [Bacillus weihaiensis]